MKEIKITVPEGYEVDKEKSTFEKIVFKKYDRKPEWKDIGKISGWYVSALSEILFASSLEIRQSNKNVFPSKEEAEACLALSQLCQWRDKYNKGWKPDWEDKNEAKYIITIYSNEIIKGVFYPSNTVLHFKTEEIRDKFLQDFRELIEIAKPLL